MAVLVEPARGLDAPPAGRYNARVAAGNEVSSVVFEKMRRQVKWVIVAVAVAFAVTLLYVGGPALFGSRQQAEPAIARVNGEEIGQLAFQRAFASQLRAYEQQVGLVRPTQLEEIRYQALNRIIALKLLTQAARDEGIRVSRSEVEKRLGQVRDSFPSVEEYRRQLELNRMTEQDLRQAIQESLVVEKLQEKLASRVSVNEDEVVAAYEQVRVRHILIRPKRPEDEGWKEAEKEARALFQQLKGGADFARLAEARSEDEATREQGGDLGFVSRGALPEPLDQAAFSLELGQVSEPLKTELGYHILQVTDRREAHGEEFERAKPELTERIRQEKASESFARWFEDLRQQASVEILDPQLAAREALSVGAMEAALAHYKKALEADPNNPYVRYGMARVLGAMGREEESLAALEQAAALESNDPVLQMELANAYFRYKNDKEKAAAALRRASELAPMDLQIHLALYAMFSNMGLADDAARELKELEKIQQVLEQQRQLQEEFARRLQQQQGEGQAPAPGTSGDSGSQSGK